MSVDMEISISTDNTEEIKEAARQQLLVALEAVGLQAEANTKRIIATGDGFDKPIVDTGRLLNSITHGVDADEQCAYVGTNVEYAPYVEYGTSKTKARPFLKNAVQNNKEEYKEIFEEYMKS